MVRQTSVMVMLILVSKHREMKKHFPGRVAVAPEEEVIMYVATCDCVSQSGAQRGPVQITFNGVVCICSRALE